MTSGIKPAAAWRSPMKAKVFNLAAKVHWLGDVWWSGAMLLPFLFYFFQTESKIMCQNWRVMKYLLIELWVPRAAAAAAAAPPNKSE